jgi:glycosyltransferase involved in cell wall biosynthesis
MSIKISGVVITKNEVGNIIGCLQSLHWCDEVLVVDSFSSDGTVEIAKENHATVIQNKFENYAAQRNFAIAQASYDWIFMIDADERATDNLKDEIILTIKNKETPAFDAYWIRRQEFMFGKFLEHGGWNNYQRIFLFNRKLITIERDVHEEITTSGKAGKLINKVLHFSHLQLDDFIYKMNTYTSIEALSAYKRDQKPSYFNLLIIPIVRFLYKYFIQQGYKDGIHGFVVSIMLGVYSFTREAKTMLLFFQHTNKKSIENTLIDYKISRRRS